MRQEITGSQVRAWRKENKWTLAKLGAALGGLSVDQTSKMENGTRKISPAESRLLKILMDRQLPHDYPSLLQCGREEIPFPSAEWELISNMARAVGTKPQEWIAHRIREYLVYQAVRSRGPHPLDQKE